MLLATIFRKLWLVPSCLCCSLFPILHRSREAPLLTREFHNWLGCCKSMKQMITFYENENNPFVVSRFSCMQREGIIVLSSSKTCEKLLTETKTKNCEKLLTKKEESLASRSRVVIFTFGISALILIIQIWNLQPRIWISSFFVSQVRMTMTLSVSHHRR